MVSLNSTSTCCFIEVMNLKIFSLSIGGKALASYANIPIWGTLPIDPRVATLSRNFQSAITGLPNTTFADVFNDIVKNKIKKHN